MSEELKSQLEAFISGMLTKAENATVWAEGEIPLLIQEWLSWLFVESAIHTVIFFIPFVIITFFYVRTMRLLWNDSRDEALMIPASFLYVILGGGTLVPTLINFLQAVKVIVAPRVVILEKGLSLIGGGGS